MEIRETRQGAVTVLTPVGPLVGAGEQRGPSSDVDKLRARLAVTSSRSLGRFVLDLSAVPYIDSAGLELLVDTADEVADAGRNLKLCGTNETLREVLDLTELNEMFEYFSDAADAARSFL